MALFLPCRDGKHRFWVLPPANRTRDRRTSGMYLPRQERSVHQPDCWRAAHSCGAAGPQAVPNFSGPAGDARRCGRYWTKRCWCCRYGRRSGTSFPAGYPSAGRRCGKCTCRRRGFRRSSGNHPRKFGRRWDGPHPVRRQRNRRAVRRPALHSRRSGRRWNGLRPGRRQTVPRRRRKSGSQTGSRRTRRRNAYRKRKCRSRSQGCPSRSWWPSLSPCAPPCSPPCPAGSGLPRR